MDWPFMLSERNTRLKFINSMVIGVPQKQLNEDMMIAITLMENDLK